MNGAVVLALVAKEDPVWVAPRHFQSGVRGHRNDSHMHSVFLEHHRVSHERLFRVCYCREERAHARVDVCYASSMSCCCLTGQMHPDLGCRLCDSPIHLLLRCLMLGWRLLFIIVGVSSGAA